MRLLSAPRVCLGEPGEGSPGLRRPKVSGAIHVLRRSESQVQPQQPTGRWSDLVARRAPTFSAPRSAEAVGSRLLPSPGAVARLSSETPRHFALLDRRRSAASERRPNKSPLDPAQALHASRAQTRRDAVPDSDRLCPRLGQTPSPPRPSAPSKPASPPKGSGGPAGRRRDRPNGFQSGGGGQQAALDI